MTKMRELEQMLAMCIRELKEHQYCGDCYPENGWESVNTVLYNYKAMKRRLKALEKCDE